MKKFRKLFAAVIVLCLSFSAFSVNAESGKTQYYYATSYALSDGAVPEVKTVLSVSETVKKYPQATYDYIVAQMLNQSPEIYVFDKRIETNDLQNLFQHLRDSRPELYFLERGYGYSSSGGYVWSIIPGYEISGEEYERTKEVYNSELKKIVDRIPETVSTVEKILLVHDYIADRFSYDTTYLNYDVYTMLTENTGVCQAYTLLFIAVMNELGIDCSYVSSETAVHIWNAVKLDDGYYYHLDVTWDDPMGSALVEHDNFLISTETMLRMSEKKSDWVSPVLNFGSDKYENGYVWNGADYPFRYLNGAIYGAKEKNGGLAIDKCSSDLKSYSEEIAAIPACYWSVRNNTSGIYKGFFSGFTLVGNTFIVNDSDKIFCCRKTGGSWNTTIIPYKKTIDTDYYYSLSDENGNIVLKTGNAPNKIDDVRDVIVPFPIIAKNGNSWADALVQTRKSLLDEPQPEVNTDFLDMNGDNAIDIRDLVKMKKRSAAAAA